MNDTRKCGGDVIVRSLAVMIAAAMMNGCRPGGEPANSAASGARDASPAEVVDAAEGSSTGSIVLDGAFGDWVGIEPAVVDPVDAPDGEVDLGSIAVASDEQYLYLSIELRREINVQRLDGTLAVVFDADGEDSTGAALHGLSGADIAVQFSPPHRTRPEARHMGVGLMSPTHAEDELDEATWLNIYDTGFFFAPTFANEVIECRIDRGASVADTAALFTGGGTRLKLALLDGEGAVVDETDIIEHRFSVPFEADLRHVAAGSDPLATAPDALRVITWNVRRGAMLGDPDPFRRIVRALKPDVMLLEEVPDDTTVDQLRSVLPVGVFGDNAEPWHVQIGESGGDLRTAVASRIPFEESAALKMVTWTDRPDRTVRTMGVVIEHRGRHILLSPVHLKCCGRIGSSEDETRTEEVTLLGNAIQRAMIGRDIEGIVVGGDLNLVGGHEPLTRLRDTLDDRIAPINAMRLDGRSNVTWHDPNEPFVPGRLDFLLISEDSLAPERAFVFDTADLDRAWLTHYELRDGDAAAVSDHRPVVADLRWVDPAGGSLQND